MAPSSGRKLGVYSLGFLKDRRLRQALAAAGWDVVAGPLSRDIEAVGIWGARPVSARGVRAAGLRGVPLVHIEDAFLRSVTAGTGAPVMGLTIDCTGNYLDMAGPSDLEILLNRPVTPPDAAELAVFDDFLRSGLSKYNDHWRPSSELPSEPFVLVVDQLRGDASIALGGAGADTFASMLDAAMSENPGLPVYIKRHPRAVDAPERGHFSDLPEGARFLPDGFSVADVLARAQAVYCVTSQVGFEAILRGHIPRVFGGAFYAGWGLSRDEMALPRRVTAHTPAGLFQRVMVEYPVWFDVYGGGVADFSSALRGLEARRRAHFIKVQTGVAVGMRRWKRRFVTGFLGPCGFCDAPGQAIAKAERKDVVVWASREPSGLAQACARAEVTLVRMEDGFLRSVGLGADLTEPLSLCLDDLGIYYDPSGPSRLERLIEASRALSPAQLARARAVRQRVVKLGLSKYNTGAEAPAAPKGVRVLLVPGQVEDDASIRLGTGEVRTNLDLLKVARRDNPEAYIVYKPHPDVEAGLRIGAVPDDDLAALCDQVLRGVSAQAALDMADEVWTMTSLIGFEALMRDKQVVCFGQPFYAGWGLTKDRAAPLERRAAGVSLDALVHATLIDYPVYRDPLSGLACPVEVVIERLASGAPKSSLSNRVLAAFQGSFAGQSRLWR